MADHTKVEVYHCADAMAREFWMYLAPGSGNFFDVGRTLVRRSHATQSKRGSQLLRALETEHAALRAQGYDSVQCMPHRARIPD